MRVSTLPPSPIHSTPQTRERQRQIPTLAASRATSQSTKPHAVMVSVSVSSTHASCASLEHWSNVLLDSMVPPTSFTHVASLTSGLSPPSQASGARWVRSSSRAHWRRPSHTAQRQPWTLTQDHSRIMCSTQALVVGEPPKNLHDVGKHMSKGW